MNKFSSEVATGEAAAAVLAAGIGIFMLGVLTTLKASAQAIKNLLAFYPPTGPLSGQTTVAVAVWLLAWAVLHFIWKEQEVNFRKIFIIALILIVLGFLGSFPPLFEVFFEAYE
jgi:uncharacterized membrane protein